MQQDFISAEEFCFFFVKNFGTEIKILQKFAWHRKYSPTCVSQLQLLYPSNPSSIFSLMATIFREGSYLNEDLAKSCNSCGNFGDFGGPTKLAVFA